MNKDSKIPAVEPLPKGHLGDRTKVAVVETWSLWEPAKKRLVTKQRLVDCFAVLTFESPPKGLKSCSYILESRKQAKKK